jgi:hypothetical protein
MPIKKRKKAVLISIEVIFTLCRFFAKYPPAVIDSNLLATRPADDIYQHPAMFIPSLPDKVLPGWFGKKGPEIIQDHFFVNIH